MGDLCQNCGDCHLGSHPRPCSKDLVECHICHNFGHQFIFCPKSVKIVDKSFEYFMICHNCDQWHLPKPCQYDFAHCNRCNNYGHLPHFCPRDPIQRGQDPNSVTYAVNVSQIHPELLRKIQVDVCTDLLRLVEKHTKEEVSAYLSRPILPPLHTAVATAPSNLHVLPAPRQLHSGDGHVHQRQHSNAGQPPPVVAYDSPFDHQQIHQGSKAEDPNSSPNVPPTPRSPFGQTSAPDLGPKLKQQKLEDTDDVKIDAAQTKAGGKVKGNRTPSVTKDKVTKPKSTTRRALQPRCADCKKRHKRCEHGSNAPNVGDVYVTSQSPQPVQTPSAKAGAGPDFGNDIGTPGPIGETPSALVRLPVFQSDRHDAGMQMMFSAQGNDVRAMTQQQEDALGVAAAAMSALPHQNSPQYQDNFGQTQWTHNAAQQAICHQQVSLPPVVESQAAITLPSLMSSNQGHPHLAGFWPQAHVLESNGHVFIHTDQQMMQDSGNTNTIDPNQMSRSAGLAPTTDHRVIAPNHHNSDHVFGLDDNNQVVDSVEQEGTKEIAVKGEASAEGRQGDGADNAETSNGGAGGRKPDEDEMLD